MMNENKKSVDLRTKLLMIAVIIGVSLALIFYAYERNFWMPENKVTATITVKKCGINEFNYTNGMSYGENWHCEPKYWYYDIYQPSGWKQEMVHMTTAKILEFRDSAKREIITLANTKFTLDNYTNPMHIGDIVNVYEINNYFTKCNPTSISLYNGTSFNGLNMELFIKNTHFVNTTAPDEQQPFCYNYTTFQEVPVN